MMLVLVAVLTVVPVAPAVATVVSIAAQYCVTFVYASVAMSTLLQLCLLYMSVCIAAAVSATE
jgi:hypothetical protein